MSKSKNWWGAAWIEKMERLAEPKRWAQGAQYARGSQVQQIRFDGRTVTATVEAANELPYTARITFDPFSREEWDRLLANVRDPAALAASLDSGDLPLDIQTAFSKAALRFMPERYVDLHLECPCPDWLKPCKHLIAVWVKFGRDFDRDPFLLFELRGMRREELAGLRRGRAETVPEPRVEAEELAEEEAVSLSPVPLPADPAAFWAEPALPALTYESGERRLSDDDVLAKLGPPPWPGNQRSLESQLHQMYDSVYELAALALKL